MYGSHWVVTWVSRSCLSGAPSSVITAATLQVQQGGVGRWQRGPMWQLVSVGADVLVERKLTLGLLKPDKPDNLSLFAGSLLFLKGRVLGDPVTCLYQEKHLPIILVRSLTHICDVHCFNFLSFYRLLQPLPCFLCCSGRVLPSYILNHFLVFSSLSQRIFAGILPVVAGSCQITH